MNNLARPNFAPVTPGYTDLFPNTDDRVHHAQRRRPTPLPASRLE